MTTARNEHPGGSRFSARLVRPTAIAAWACAVTVLAGCGSDDDRILQDPAVQQRLEELEEEDRLRQQEHQRRLKEFESKHGMNAPLNDLDGLDGIDDLLDDDPNGIDVEGQDDEHREAPPLQPAEDEQAAAASPWSKLRFRMNGAEVRQLLGEPTHESRDFALIYWHYGQGTGAGRVSLLAGSGELFAWETPLE